MIGKSSKNVNMRYRDRFWYIHLFTHRLYTFVYTQIVYICLALNE